MAVMTDLPPQPGSRGECVLEHLAGGLEAGEHRGFSDFQRRTQADQI